MKRLILWAILLFGGISYAQSDDATLYWQEANITVLLPFTWTHYPQTSPDVETLTLAPSLASSPEFRPDGLLVVVFTRYNNPITPQQALRQAFQSLNLTQFQSIPRLDGTEAIGSGYSADGLLFGFGQARLLSDGTTLALVSRGLSQAQSSVISTFNMQSGSYAEGEDIFFNTREYGTLWGITVEAVLDAGALSAFALSPTQQLYVATANAGILVFEAQTGILRQRIPYKNDEPREVGSMTISNTALYVFDRFCACIETYREGAWQATEIEVQSLEAQLLVTPNDVLYLSDTAFTRTVDDSTDTANDELFALVYRIESGIQTSLFFEETLSVPPLLALDAGERLHTVNRDDGSVFIAEGVGFSELLTLPLPSGLVVESAIITSDNQWLVFPNGENIFRLSADGILIKEITLPFDVLYQGNYRHLLASQENIFLLSDDALSITSREVPLYRKGGYFLSANQRVVAEGFTGVGEQVWFFNALRNEPIVLSAVPDLDSPITLALRVISPDGNDLVIDTENNALNLSAESLIFNAPQEGLYVLVVSESGEAGTYSVGLSKPKTLEGESENRATLGILAPSLPVQRWQIEVQSGMSLSATLTPESGTLDPLLRLYNPQGTLVAENDDAEDGSLGFGAQLSDITLSFNGTYTLEVQQISGEGVYQLSIMLGN